MIPFRGDQFDHFNNGQPVNRHVVIFPHQQQPLPQHLMQPPSLMYHTPAQNFAQPYPGGMPMHHQQQQSFMLISTRARPQQSWVLPSPSPPMTSTPTFVSTPSTTFHPIQSSQSSFGAGTGIPQPSFSGGTGISQTPFNSTANAQPVSLGNGTGIPQPAFRGGTAMLKRKSHYLEESDADSFPSFTYDNTNDMPFLMSLPPQPYTHTHHPQQQQQQQHQQQFRPPNPRLRFPPATEASNNQHLNPRWANSERPSYPMPPQIPQPISNEQQVLTSQLFQRHQLISIDTLLKEPGRSQRPAQIIIFLRGLPGSGKSYVADLIKNEEESQSEGTNKPKILSLDSYFLTENQQETKDPKTGKITKTSTMEYEYDSKMEEAYRKSLIKQVRKAIDDRFYPFIIVDQNNEQLGHFREMADYAEANQFRVYFVELNNDPNSCAQRNTHQRSLADIQQIQKRWEHLPLHYEILDIRSLLQSDAIDEVEMDDAPAVSTEQHEIEEEEESQITKKSKWEAMMETNPDRLDGVYQRRNSSSSLPASPPIEKRLNNTTISMDEQSADLSPNLQSKKKKVRWADIEESALHLHKRAVGFVVGQSEQDWQRMSDDYDPSQKLNHYKYI